MKHLQMNLRCIALVAACAFAIPALAQDTYVPVKWQKFVTVAGQAEPIPEQWLQDDEARVAHSLVLPDGVPKPVPYSFSTGLFGDHRKQSIAYFDHLCKTEVGQIRAQHQVIFATTHNDANKEMQ